mmetsp:Transcript_10262/g.12985  ORF Transcript_10262/g.12985 Transcript_10262/m.12985 type:complete len:303 (-) Transcript_10262:59-967(-)
MAPGRRFNSINHAFREDLPAPLTSIYLRGEWSMGVVQDIYWKFCQIGLLEIMEEYHKSTSERLKQDFVEVMQDYTGRNMLRKNNQPFQEVNNTGSNAYTMMMDGYPVYIHSHMLSSCDVFDKWDFPAAQLNQAWRFWLIGQPHNEFERRMEDGSSIIEIAPIRPFRLLKRLPKTLKQKYRNSWSPILKMMENAPAINIPEDKDGITDEFITSSYSIAMEYILSQFEFIAKNNKKKYETWTVGTWCTRTKFSEVEKHGTPEDIGRLPTRNERYNKKHTHKRTFRTSNKAKAKQARIQRVLAQM